MNQILKEINNCGFKNSLKGEQRVMLLPKDYYDNRVSQSVYSMDYQQPQPAPPILNTPIQQTGEKI